MRFALALAVTVCCAHCLATDGETKEFKKFLTLEAPKVVSAYDHKNSAFFDSLYTPNFQTKDEHGVINGKKIAMYLLRYHFNTLQKIDYQIKVLSLTAAKGTATVTLISVLHGVTQARRGSKGAPLTVTRFEKQIFVKGNNGWQMALDQDIKPAKLIMPNAQPFAPMKLTPVKKRP